MLRYTYPLAMLVLLVLMCGCVPINLAENGWVIPLLAMGGGLALTAVWPFWVGPRLHEPAWRKLAERLHLTYRPFSRDGLEPAARIEGLHGGREVRLTTRRVRRQTGKRRRGPLMQDFLSLTVPLDRPPNVRLEIRNKSRSGRNPRLEELPPTGRAAFDRRLALFVRPESLVDVLSAGDLLDDLAQVVQPGRAATIKLRDDGLLFEEQSNLFTGAESRPERLERLLSVMARLADALSGPDSIFDAEAPSPELNSTPPAEAAPVILPASPEPAKDVNTRLIGALTTIIAGLVSGASGLIVWFPAYLITMFVGQPTHIGVIVLFWFASVVGGLLGGVAGTLVCAKVGKSRYGKQFDWRGAVWFGLCGIIIGVVCAFVAAIIPGLFFSPNSQ